MNEINLLRIQQVTRHTGYPRTTLYRHIANGLFTRPVKIGERASAWPDYEVTAIQEARIAGKRREEIVKLVNGLHGIRNWKETVMEGAQ